jgi:hypothetical protein
VDRCCYLALALPLAASLSSLTSYTRDKEFKLEYEDKELKFEDVLLKLVYLQVIRRA